MSERQTTNEGEQMMTITIAKGNQCDASGYSAMWGGRDACGKVDGERITCNEVILGYYYSSDVNEVNLDTAIRATVADGQTRVVEIARVTAEPVRIAARSTGVCPRCHTYCDGDCSAAR